MFRLIFAVVFSLGSGGLFAAAYLAGLDTPTGEILGNLATEVFGILVTIALVDWFLEMRRRQDSSGTGTRVGRHRKSGTGRRFPEPMPSKRGRPSAVRRAFPVSGGSCMVSFVGLRAPHTSPGPDGDTGCGAVR